MIPYFKQPALHLGPITIHAFGVLVATGILLALRLIRRRAPGAGLDPALAEKVSMRMVVVGFILAHVIDRLAYYPEDVLKNPLSLLYIWESISSFGGFVGATLVAVWFVRKHGRDGWRYLDLIASVFPTAWLFGRLGCTLAFDHPGFQTTFFLGQRYTDQVVRHNLGLYEALATIPLVLFFHHLRKGKARPAGFYVGMLAACYAPVRFLLDFLRWDDARYWGFTPGQYGAVALWGVGFVILRRVARGADSASSPSPAASSTSSTSQGGPA